MNHISWSGRDVVVAVVGLSCLTIGLSLLAFGFFPFCERCRMANFVSPAGGAFGPWSTLTTWDAQHFLSLSEVGYSPSGPSIAFYPLYPFIIWLTQFLFFGQRLLAGLFVSFVSFLAGSLLLLSYTAKRFGRSIAEGTLLLFFVFPMSFYFRLVYAESLFFLLTMVFFWGLYRQSASLLFLAGFFLPLSRAQGVFFVVPLAVSYFQEWSKTRSLLSRHHVSGALGLILGSVGYLLVMQVFTGNPFAGYLAYRGYVASYSLSLLVHPVRWFVGNFFLVPYTLHGFNTSVINRLFFVGFILLLFPAFKKLKDPVLLSYVLVMGFVPALGGYFMSYPRYLVLLFPLFIVMAKIFGKWTHEVAFVFFALQIFFMLAHALNYWVA